MPLSGLQDRDAEIHALLAVARREILLLAVASSALDDDGVAVASARVRWAIGSARQLIAAADHGADAEDPRIARHVAGLESVANRAQRWLVSEPALPLATVRALVDRLAARRGPLAPRIDASDASLVDLDVDELDLGCAVLRGAVLTEITARRARCAAADARATRWSRCELVEASLAMAVFAGATLDHCDLARANLEGTSWHRATLRHCRLARARLIDARLDRAVFRDCDLRGVDLEVVRSPYVASLAGARFERCDLRDTNWTGRDLGGAVFADCALAGAIGAAPGLRAAPL